MATTTYISTYKKIGPLLVQRVEDTMTVLSVLGVRSYVFDRLPHCGDGSMIKFALKYYFDETKKECRPADGQTGWPTVSGLLNFFFAKPALLPGKNFHEQLCFEISSQMRTYSQEDIRCFGACRDIESVLGALERPPCLSLIGFDRDFLIDEASLDIKAKELVGTNFFTMNNRKCEGVIDHFLAGEAKYFLDILEYKKKLEEGQLEADGDISSFFEIVRSQEKFLEIIIARFGAFFVQSLPENRVEELRLSSEVLAAALAAAQADGKASCDHKDAAGIPSRVIDIARIIIENFDLFLPYSDFVKRFGSSIDSLDMGYAMYTCVMTIIQKITGLPQGFRSFFSYGASVSMQIAYMKLFKFGRRLNRLAETCYLEKARRDLLNGRMLRYGGQEEDDSFLDGELLAKTTCHTEADREMEILLFAQVVAFFGANGELLEKIPLSMTDIAVFERRIFIFVESNKFRTRLFKELHCGYTWYTQFCYKNREVIREFRDTFYRIKYGATAYKGVYCTASENQHTDILIVRENEGIAQKQEQRNLMPDLKIKAYSVGDERANGTIPEACIGQKMDEAGISLHSSHSAVGAVHRDAQGDGRIGSTAKKAERSQEAVPAIHEISDLNIDAWSAVKACQGNEGGLAQAWADASRKIHFDVRLMPARTRIGGVTRLTEDEIFEHAAGAYKKKVAEDQQNAGYLLKLQILLGNIPHGKHVGQPPQTDKEYEIPFSQKRRLFEDFMKSIKELAASSTGIAFTNEKMNIDGTHILEKYFQDDIKEHLGRYEMIVHKGRPVSKALAGAGLRDAAALFVIFLQKNIYVFLSPADLEGMRASIQNKEYGGLEDRASPANRRYARDILGVSAMLFQWDRPLANALTETWYGRAIADECFFEKILKMTK